MIIMVIAFQPRVLMELIQTCEANARRLIAAQDRCAMATVFANHRNVDVIVDLKLSTASVLKNVKLVWCVMTMVAVFKIIQTAHKGKG